MGRPPGPTCCFPSPESRERRLAPQDGPRKGTATCPPPLLLCSRALSTAPSRISPSATVQSVSGLPLASTVHRAGGLSLAMCAPGAGTPRACKCRKCTVSPCGVQNGPETCPESKVRARNQAARRTAVQAEEAGVAGTAVWSFLSVAPLREACPAEESGQWQKNRVCLRFGGVWHIFFSRLIPPSVIVRLSILIIQHRV